MQRNLPRALVTAAALALCPVMANAQFTDLDHREYLEVVDPLGEIPNVRATAVAADGLTVAVSYQTYSGNNRFAHLTVFQRAAPGQPWTATPMYFGTTIGVDPVEGQFEARDVDIEGNRMVSAVQRHSTGAAEIREFRRVNGVWQFVQVLAAPGASGLQEFGKDLDLGAPVAPLGGTPIQWLAVGAADDNPISSSGGATGQVFVFNRPPSAPLSFVGVFGSPTGPNQGYGLSVGVDGNMCVVGEYVTATGTANAQLYTFGPLGMTLTQTIPIPPFSGAATAQLPESIDLDDTNGLIAVGAPEGDFFNMGNAAIFSAGPAGPYSVQQTLTSPILSGGSNSGQRFGRKVRFNGQGDLLVTCGSPKNVDSAFLYTLAPSPTDGPMVPLTWLGRANTTLGVGDFAGDYAVTGIDFFQHPLGDEHRVVVHRIGSTADTGYSTPCLAASAPCGNTSTLGCRNGDGWAGAMLSAGTASVADMQASSDNSLRLFTTTRSDGAIWALSGQPAYANASTSAPFSNGLLGLSSPQRLLFGDSDDWIADRREYLVVAYGLLPGGIYGATGFDPQAGDDWSFQIYYRDGAACGGSYNYTNTVDVTFTP